MEAETYYTTYYPAFTPKEKKHLRQFLGQDYLKRDLKEEQVHRVLARLRPSVRRWLKTKDILPFLSQKSVLTDTEIHHLKSGDVQQQEQAIRLVEFLMNKGTYGIATLYLCLLESSEQVHGIPGHYQLAGELKEIVHAECGITVSTGVAAVNGTDQQEQQQQSLQTLVRRLCKVPLDPDTAKTFISNLGMSPSDFRTLPTQFAEVCQQWLSRGSAPGDLDELVEALITTRGLGRHTSKLCSPASGAPLVVRNFLLSLGERWVELARYLGFSEEEVEAITGAHTSSTEQQVVEFLKLWQLPECGQRTLPLMHKLKALAGIVEPRNPSRRLDKRPGRLAYMNRHLKTDIMGKPHRSLDTYDHPSSSLGGVGVGGGNPASTGRSTFQRARSLGSSDYHQHTQGRGSSHGYQTEGRGTSSGYQTEGHGLSNGYQDERRVSPYGAKGEGRGSSSMYQGSQDYQSPAGYQSDGQQQPSSAYDGDYEDSYGSGYGSRYGSGYGGGHGGGYGSRDLREQDPVIEELPDDQQPHPAPSSAPAPTPPPRELHPPLVDGMDSDSDLEPTLPPPPDSYIDEQGFSVITNGLALPSDNLAFCDSEPPKVPIRKAETTTANVTGELNIQEDDTHMKFPPSSDTLAAGSLGEPKRDGLSGETATAVFTNGLNIHEDDIHMKHTPSSDTVAAGSLGEPKRDGLSGETATAVFANGLNIHEDDVHMKHTPSSDTVAAGDLGQPKRNELSGETATAVFTSELNIHEDDIHTKHTPSSDTLAAGHPDEQNRNELSGETATAAFTSGASLPEGDALMQPAFLSDRTAASDPGRPRSSERFGEAVAVSYTSELTSQESSALTERTEGSEDLISDTQQRHSPVGVTLMGNEVFETETETRRSDEEVRSNLPVRKPSDLPLHPLEDEPDNDLSAVTPDSSDEGPVLSVPVQESATDGDPVMVGLQPSQAVDSQGVMMQPMLGVSRRKVMLGAQGTSSQPVAVGMYKSIQSTDSELVLQPLHSVGSSPVVANAQLVPSVAAGSQSALQATGPSDHLLTDTQPHSIQPSSTHTQCESDLELANNFSTGPIHSPVQAEHTGELHIPQEPSLSSVMAESKPQPLQDTGSEVPDNSFQPQQEGGAMGLFPPSATSPSASPLSSRASTPVDMREGERSTSEIPSTASPSLSPSPSPSAHSSHSGTQEHMMGDLEEDEDLVLGSQELSADVMERDSVARGTCSEDVVRALEDPEGLEMLTALVNSGASINAPTADGTYPIHLAISSGTTDKLLFLLNNNCNINAARPDGKTALHLACIRKDFQMVQILVEKGADPATQDQQSFTCLHFKETLESLDIVRYLLHNGTPVDQPCKDSYLTPLLVCCFAGETTFEAASLLVAKGASVNGSSMASMKPLITSCAESYLRMVDLLLDSGVDLTVCDQEGCSALLKACQNNHTNVARRLCERGTDANRQGIDVNRPNKDGLTPLMAAVTNSNQDLVATLITHGANINCSHRTNLTLAGSNSYPMEMTPLADAAARGHLGIVQVLVDSRAEVNAISEAAFPPIAFAVMGNHVNIVEYFLKLNDLNTSLAGLSQPFVVAMKAENRQCAELLAERYGGIERLLEDAVQEGMHELVEQIRLYQQMDGNGSPPAVVTPVQPAPQVELISQLPNPSPPPSTQDEPLNDFSDEALNRFDEDLESDSSHSSSNLPPQNSIQSQSPPPQQPAASPVPVPVQAGASVSIPTHTLNDFNQPPVIPPSSQHQPHPPRTSPQPTAPSISHTHPTFTQAPTSTTIPTIPTPSASHTSAPTQSPWQPAALPPQAASSQPWQPRTLPPLGTSFVDDLGPPVRAVLPNHPHSGAGSVSLQQAGDVARAQVGEGTGATPGMGEEHDPHSLFVARPKSPPPVASESTVPQTVLPAPDSLNHSVVEVLHEFAQFCISAAVRDKGHEWLVDRAVSTGHSHIVSFFMQYFENSAVFARDGKLVAEFIGGSPSPLNFLLGGHYVTKSDFEAVLQEIGRPEFMEQLMLALHQFPDSENLPWTASALMDSLFNQHFAIGSQFPSPDSAQPADPTFTPTSDPTPTPPPQTSAYTFPTTGGHQLGWGGDEERNRQSQLMGLATSKPHTTSTPPTSTQPPITTCSEGSAGGSAATMSRVHTLADARGTGSSFGGATAMDSTVVKTKGVASAAASFMSPLPSLVQAETVEEEDDSDDYELNDLSVLDDPEPSFEPELPLRWQSEGASGAATGSNGGSLPISQLQPQLHSKTQPGASLEAQLGSRRFDNDTSATSSVPPFHQQSQITAKSLSTVTTTATASLPKKTETTSTATKTSIVAKPTASVSSVSASVGKPTNEASSRQSSNVPPASAAMEPSVGFSLPPQSRSQSLAFQQPSLTSTTVTNVLVSTTPSTSMTQPPVFQQRSFSSSSLAAKEPLSASSSFTQPPTVSTTSLSSRHPAHTTVNTSEPQVKENVGAFETQQPPSLSFPVQSKVQSSISERKPLTSTTVANVLVAQSTSTQAPVFQQRPLTSSSPITTGAVSASLSSFIQPPMMSTASPSSSTSHPVHSFETVGGPLEKEKAPKPNSKAQSLAELHHMLSATGTEPMKTKTGIPTPRHAVTKPANAASTLLKSSGSISKPQTPNSPKPSRIPVRIRKVESPRSSKSSSIENISSKLPSSVNTVRKPPTNHPKRTSTTVDKKPSSISKPLRGASKQPASASKLTSPSTSTLQKVQPLATMPHKSPASTYSPPSKTSPKAASPGSRTVDGGTWEKTAFSASTDEETDFEEQEQPLHGLTRNESGYSTTSVNGSSASRAVKREASSPPVREVVFPPVPITDCESQLFEMLSHRVQKWKILGRYLGLEDETLDRIEVENQFRIERCYKMLDTWKKLFRSDATYRRLEEGLRNVMREDILLDIGHFIPCCHDDNEEPLNHTVDVTSKENPNLHSIRDEFQQQKNNGMKRAYVTLEYHSDEALHRDALCFIAPSLDDLRVLEDLCKFAGSRGQREVFVSLRYLDH